MIVGDRCLDHVFLDTLYFAIHSKTPELFEKCCTKFYWPLTYYSCDCWLEILVKEEEEQIMSNTLIPLLLKRVLRPNPVPLIIIK